MTNYTYNLKIIFTNEKNDKEVIIDDVELENIKYQLSKEIIHSFKYKNKIYKDIKVKWMKKDLNNIEQHFYGDLFTCCRNIKDCILIKHTRLSLEYLNNTQYDVKFYISKMCNENH